MDDRQPSGGRSFDVEAPPTRRHARMEYRRRPVSVAVDPVSLVISECIAITSAIQKHARSSHSSVSAILGGGPSTLSLRPAVPPGQHERSTSPAPRPGLDNSQDGNTASRWGLRGQRGKSIQDNPLMAGFGKLRHELASVRDITNFDALSLLAPFLHVMQTKGTAAPITVLTLGALRKFLAYGFMSPESPRFALAIQSLSVAVTRCIFDGSDPNQIEVVLIMILQLLEDIMSGPGGDMLSDESVCDMIGRGLAICSKPRFSPVLRCAAEASLIRMCQIIFEDIKHLEAEAGADAGAALDNKSKGDMDNIRIDPSSASDIVILSYAAAAAATDESPRQSSSEPAARVSTDSPPAGSTTSTPEDSSSSPSRTTDAPDTLDLRPYSLPSIKELFRVLVGCLDPDDRQNTDGMRVVALRIIHVVLEVAGGLIARHAALATIAEDRLCCYLFQLVRSDNMAILQEALIVAGSLLTTCRHILKLQQELYLSYLIACLHPLVEIPLEPGIDPSLYAGIPQTPKLVKPPPSQSGSGRSTPVPVKDRQKLGLEGGARKPDARQAMVEGVGVLARMPSFMAELFVNYDCDVDRADLCEDMIGLLSRNALPDSATWSTTSVPPLCLDALLRYIHFVSERLDWSPDHDGYPPPSVLRENRRLKKIIIKATNTFNENPVAGLAYLQREGIIRDTQDPKSVAQFLKATSRVSKRVLGEFLSKRGNEAILEAYMDLFDFSNKRVDMALRVMLEAFRLPGEAPLISRIISAFSEKYSSSDTPLGTANKDAVLILSFAIIILNTDQHNPNIKHQKRMGLEDFSRNLRGQNGGEDFAPDYLRDIFDSIKANEIILPDEHDNKHGFDYAWKELLLKTGASGPLVTCNTNIYDADMFAATWRPVISTLSYVFMSATDDAVFARVVSGFDESARIAARHGLTEALDHIIYCLSHMTTMATDMPFNTSLNTEVQAGDHSVMVSELAVKLGRDVRAQLATLVLFRVVNGSETVIMQGWRNVVRVWLNLFVNSLIPPYFSAEAALPIPPIPLHTPSLVIDRASKSAETGFFSAFTSYISSYAADDPPEPSDEELESTLCTVDCINSCHVGDIFANISKLGGAQLVGLVNALLAELPDDGSMAVMTVKNQGVPSSGQSGQGAAGAAGAAGEKSAGYDPSVVYILELCTVLACRDENSIEALARPVVDVLQQAMRHPSRLHPLALARATFYMFKLLHASYHLDYINIPVLLHAISSFPDEVLEKASVLVLRGFGVCIEHPGALRNEMMTSPDFWAVLRLLARKDEAAPLVFVILEAGTMGSPPAIIADNYEASVSLLNDFASAAGFGAHRRPVENQARRSRDLSEDSPHRLLVRRGVRAVELLQQITRRIPPLMRQSHLESSDAWSAYWLPMFDAFTAQCTNPCREVRLHAFTSLQRTLLAPDLACSDPKEWTAIFGQILFPLILRLLKPEVYSSDREGMSEMRVQSASLLCKVFLQYLVLLSGWDGMLDLWLEIIDIMDRLMNSGQGDSLEEAVRENLKNVVLFMSSNDLLVDPSRDPSKERIWQETWKRIDRFLPDLRSDLPIDEGASPDTGGGGQGSGQEVPAEAQT